MKQNLDFSGRVAVITGAGGGLGKEYALFLAAAGASVVVNDLGGSVQGQGASSKPADLVVDLIRRNGGIAIADYHNVSTEGVQVIKTAIDAFGRVDILINNAGY
jgi:NAD(P)-dependent dehydrogenase (short-subunit alcohol dehydrogenase family)